MHASGVVHRDLKPANILFSNKSKDSEIKIIDLGLASKIAPRAKLHEAVGTPYFVAPEIVANSVNYDTEVDLWSTGVILFNMLTGYMPFDGESCDDLYDNIERCKFNKKITDR